MVRRLRFTFYLGKWVMSALLVVTGVNLPHRVFSVDLFSGCCHAAPPACIAGADFAPCIVGVSFPPRVACVRLLASALLVWTSQLLGKNLWFFLPNLANLPNSQPARALSRINHEMEFEDPGLAKYDVFPSYSSRFAVYGSLPDLPNLPNIQPAKTVAQNGRRFWV
jgi:hypothetical protein